MTMYTCAIIYSKQYKINPVVLQSTEGYQYFKLILTEGQTLPTDCWPQLQFHVDVKDYSDSLGITCDDLSLAIVGFIYRDYRYKLIVAQITHNSGLEPIPYTGEKFFPHRGSNQHRIPKYEFKAQLFKPCDHGPGKYRFTMTWYYVFCSEANYFGHEILQLAWQFQTRDFPKDVLIISMS